jgi:hypothetical protein
VSWASPNSIPDPPKKHTYENELAYALDNWDRIMVDPVKGSYNYKFPWRPSLTTSFLTFQNRSWTYFYLV